MIRGCLIKLLNNNKSEEFGLKNEICKNERDRSNERALIPNL